MDADFRCGLPATAKRGRAGDSAATSPDRGRGSRGIDALSRRSPRAHAADRLSAPVPEHRFATGPAPAGDLASTISIPPPSPASLPISCAFCRILSLPPSILETVRKIRISRGRMRIATIPAAGRLGLPGHVFLLPPLVCPARRHPRCVSGTGIDDCARDATGPGRFVTCDHDAVALVATLWF